jgi:hypothetical protein
MAFRKGISGNINGRPKGATDRTTKEIRELFESILNDNVGNVSKWIEETAKDNPAKAVELVMKVAEYVLPKLRFVATDNQNDVPFADLFKSMSDDELDERLSKAKKVLDLK